MKVIKNINNNVSLCLDNQGRQVVAFGKGIGFKKPPYEIPLEKIQRTFYDVDQNYLSVIAQIPEKIFIVSAKIVDYANRKLNSQYSSNAILALADHIQFAIKRKEAQLYIKLPILYEVKSLYPKEMEIGMTALDILEKEFHILFPEEEAASIALHLVDYGAYSQNKVKHNEKDVIEKCSDIIEKSMEIKIDKKSFDYFRFVTHMHYLLDRIKQNKKISSDNDRLFLSLKEEYPKTYICVLNIMEWIPLPLTEEELMYLILHINRLCVREDSNE